jgi:hypothetical protein
MVIILLIGFFVDSPMHGINNSHHTNAPAFTIIPTFPLAGGRSFLLPLPGRGEVGEGRGSSNEVRVRIY